MERKNRDVFASRPGVPTLDSLHQIAQHGYGLTALKRELPEADDTELRLWLRSNGYKE